MPLDLNETNWTLIYQLDVKELTDLIQKWITEDGTVANLLAKGHCEDRHSVQTDEEMLKRVLSETKNVSCFINEHEKWTCVDEMVYVNADKIAKWLLADKWHEHQTLALTGHIGDTIGKGVDTDLNLVTTENCTIVLQRNPTNSLFDPPFWVKTAYPNIERTLTKDDFGGSYDGPIKTTKKSLAKEASTLLDTMDNQLCKAYWTLKMAGYDVKTFGDTDKYGAGIRVYFEVDGIKCSMSYNKEHFVYGMPKPKMQSPNTLWTRVDRSNLPQATKDKIESIADKIECLYTMSNPHETPELGVKGLTKGTVFATVYDFVREGVQFDEQEKRTGNHINTQDNKAQPTGATTR